MGGESRFMMILSARQRRQLRAQFIDVFQQAPTIYGYGEKGCLIFAAALIPRADGVQCFGSHLDLPLIAKRRSRQAAPQQLSAFPGGDGLAEIVALAEWTFVVLKE